MKNQPQQQHQFLLLRGGKTLTDEQTLYVEKQIFHSFSRFHSALSPRCTPAENLMVLPAAVPLLLMLKPITNCSEKFFLLTSCFKQPFYLLFLLIHLHFCP